MRTSAADYAAAVMSSAWGLVDSPEERLVLIDQEAVEAIEEADVAITERQDVQEVVDRGGSGSVEYLSRGTSTSAGIVDKMKRFGGRMRRLLKGENGRKGNVAQFSIDVDVVRGSEQRASVPAGAIPVSVSVSSMTGNFTEISPCIQKARPSFSAQTYASSTPNPTPTQVIGTVPGINAPPMIHVTPPTHANPANRFRPNNVQFRPHVPAFPSPLPKPRPVSLSSLSRFQGGVPSSFSPESLVRHRARPRSSLPVNIEIDGFMPDVPVIRMNRRDTSGGPPGLPVPSPVPVLARDEASAKKKYRRFSLSALSSLVKGGDGDEN
jgi:hypothetical protein